VPSAYSIKYHASIGKAVSDDDKIRTIAQQIQRIEQLHPFVDGNIRTCYILLNKLLNDHGLPLSILLNPNKLDCCHLEDIVCMVKEGQQNYKKLLSNTDTMQFIMTTSETHAGNASISCDPHDFKKPALLELFYRTVINNAKEHSNHSLFTTEKTSIVDALLKQITPHLKNTEGSLSLLDCVLKGQYALALRKACAGREYEIVKQMIPFIGLLDIDINAPSSNGNTALDWLDLIPNSPTVLNVRDMLCEAGAVKNTAKNDGSPSIR
jgi:hypothetical protein